MNPNWPKPPPRRLVTHALATVKHTDCFGQVWAVDDGLDDPAWEYVTAHECLSLCTWRIPVRYLKEQNLSPEGVEPVTKLPDSLRRAIEAMDEAAVAVIGANVLELSVRIAEMDQARRRLRTFYVSALQKNT